jgi:hypothetical protein
VAAAAAAGLALPVAVPRLARAATTWTCPATIDNTGATDVSAALSDWLNTTGAPGDTFRLRWGQGFAPGHYRISSGVYVNRGITLDLAGCYLGTGAGTGAANPRLWPDQSATNWPKDRYCLSVVADGFRLRSSVPGARITGGGRVPLWTGTFLGAPSPNAIDQPSDDRNVPSRWWPYEAQHGVKLLGSGNVVDLTDIALEFVYGDGVYFRQGSSGSFVIGQRVGVPAAFGLGGTLGPGGEWLPDPTPYPGIHHTGRHGIATSDATGIWIVGLSIWHVRRSIIDLEPHGDDHSVDGVVISGTEAGRRNNAWIAAQSTQRVDNVLIADNVTWFPGTIAANLDGDEPRTVRCANWQVRDNSAVLPFTASSGTAFDFRAVDGLVVTGNRIPVEDPARGLSDPVPECTGVVVSPARSLQFPAWP